MALKAKTRSANTKSVSTTKTVSSSNAVNKVLEIAVQYKRTYSSFDEKAKRWTKYHQYVAVGATAKQISVIKQVKGSYYKVDEKGNPLFTTAAPCGTKCVWSVSACGKYIDPSPSPERLRWEELRDIEKRTPSQEKEFKSLAHEELK